MLDSYEQSRCSSAESSEASVLALERSSTQTGRVRELAYDGSSMAL
jgi:hypothetical protein